jgi:hypothetical protein
MTTTTELKPAPKPLAPLSLRQKELLARIPHLPKTAVVPNPIAAAHDGVSVKTVERRYPQVSITEFRKDVPVEYLRRHQHCEPSAA